MVSYLFLLRLDPKIITAKELLTMMVASILKCDSPPVHSCNFASARTG